MKPTDLELQPGGERVDLFVPVAAVKSPKKAIEGRCGPRLWTAGVGQS